MYNLSNCYEKNGKILKNLSERKRISCQKKCFFMSKKNTCFLDRYFFRNKLNYFLEVFFLELVFVEQDEEEDFLQLQEELDFEP